VTRTWTRALRASLIVALVVGGCSGGTGQPLAEAAPVPCAERFSVERCEAILERAADWLAVDATEIATIDIVPAPAVGPNGEALVYSGTQLVVRATLADGTWTDVPIGCGGIGDPSDAACTDDPHLNVYASGGVGYGDVPCGEDGETCATPLPSVDPDLAALAEPILVDRVDVTIDHAGAYEIPVGTGSLPNGIISESSFRLVDDWPDGVDVTEGYVRLELRSLEADGKPFWNRYVHGWYPGLERIEAVVTFGVDDFEPGAVISIADVVVR
jgi:hypothetical protein